MRGTRGYLAPEWLTNAAISEKSDVYSCGMVHLEIVSGRKSCIEDGSGMNEQSTYSWALGHNYFPLYALEMHGQGRYLELADPRLQGRVKREEVEKFIRIALCCVHEDPRLRPSMVNVVNILDGSVPPSEPRTDSLSFLRFFGRRLIDTSVIEEQNGESNLMPHHQGNNDPTSARSSSTTSSSSDSHDRAWRKIISDWDYLALCTI